MLHGTPHDILKYLQKIFNLVQEALIRGYIHELRHSQFKQTLYVEVAAISQTSGLAVFFNLWVLHGAFPELRW